MNMISDSRLTINEKTLNESLIVNLLSTTEGSL